MEVQKLGEEIISRTQFQKHHLPFKSINLHLRHSLGYHFHPVLQIFNFDFIQITPHSLNLHI